MKNGIDIHIHGCECKITDLQAVLGSGQIDEIKIN